MGERVLTSVFSHSFLAIFASPEVTDTKMKKGREDSLKENASELFSLLSSAVIYPFLGTEAT